MSEQDNLKELAEIVHASMSEFHAAMKFRDNLTIKIARRTTQIIRFGMLILLSLVAALFYLINTLTGNLKNITLRVSEVSVSIRHVEQNLVSITQEMQTMKFSVGTISNHLAVVPNLSSTLDKMGNDLAVVPILSTTIDEIGNNLGKMSSKIETINTNIAYINNNMIIMNTGIANISAQFTGVNGHLGLMDYNINRVSSPMQFFPFSR